MNILITGGAGFIGSNLVKKLNTADNKITVIDNLSTGHQDNIKDQTLHKFIPTSVDIGLGKYTRLIPENYDLVYHLGIPSSSPIYKKDHWKVGLAINDFIKILDFCKKGNTPLVYASSSSIYNNKPTPHNEQMTPYCLDYYTEARYSMERLATMYAKLHNIESAGLRFFSVYGPNEQAKKDFANIITQMILKKTFAIYGDGTQTRDFTHVNDIVKALELAGNHAYKNHEIGNKADANIFNAGTGTETSFKQAAELIQQHTPLDITYTNTPLPPGYVKRTCADTTHARKYLSFDAQISLEKGIKMQVEEYA